MNWLLRFLRDYLLPGVDDLDAPDEDAPPPDDDAPPDEDAPPPDEDTPPDEDAPPDEDEPPAPRETRAQKAIRELRESRQEVERQLATARADLEAARRPQQPAQPDPEQAVWQEEEAVLRNPEATDWQKYSVQSRRDARMATRHATQALAQAQDLSDRTAFQALAASKPKTFAAYKDRVEAKAQELRAKGVTVPRTAILHMMLGEDMMSDKLRASEKPKKTTTPAAPRRASSDVPASGRGRVSDAEARAKRLENVRI